MANSNIMKIVSLVLACMVIVEPHATDALTCGQVVSRLASCLTYLRKGGKVSWACCDSVKALNSAARTTPDRRAACQCLKNAYKATPGIKATYATTLPGKCGVHLPYKISPSIDCSKVR